MKTSPGRPTVLSVGGTDPIGAAGVTADLRHLAVSGVHGACVPTALTVQKVGAFVRADPVPQALFRESLEAAFGELPVDVVLVGMLCTEAHLRTLLVVLHNFEGKVVVDPVFEATAGASLLDAAGRGLVAEALTVRAHLVLPNVAELAALVGVPPRDDVESRAELAAELVEQGAEAVYAKGGHGSEGDVVDVFATPSGVERFAGPRRAGKFRGAGGALAAAAAAAIARGADVRTAVVEARTRVAAAIARAAARGTPFLHLDPLPAP